ncbi:MAG: preprotein translocase subunit SecG [Planctomycetes bacterium]|nr:preprotein translocase subunit SecG [Planctomycetota bacterium]MCD7895520.1 preprotein translocase subunit SecG [Planctomycetaceae bacterium]
MGVFLLLVFFFISFLIVGMVLLQEGKGGGLTGMSTGMDGVMGAKNPLRRMTAYLFVFFVIMCIGINLYFHNTRVDASIPSGIGPINTRQVLEETAPAAGPVVTSGALRPEDGDAAPAESLRPEATGETAPAAPIAPAETAAPAAETAPAAPITPVEEAAPEQAAPAEPAE